MANKKISQLEELQTANISTAEDVVAIVDSSTNETKKVKVADLLNSNQALADKNYVHNQVTVSSTWVVAHNLNKFPSVTVVDSAGTTVVGEITHNSINQATITFSAPFSGKAYFN